MDFEASQHRFRFRRILSSYEETEHDGPVRAPSALRYASPVTQPRRDFLKAFLGTTLLTGSRLQIGQTHTDDDDRYRATPDGVIATQPRIYGPDGICLASTGNLYIVDQIQQPVMLIFVPG